MTANARDPGQSWGRDGLDQRIARILVMRVPAVPPPCPSSAHRSPRHRASCPAWPRPGVRTARRTSRPACPCSRSWPRSRPTCPTTTVFPCRAIFRSSLRTCRGPPATASAFIHPSSVVPSPRVVVLLVVVAAAARRRQDLAGGQPAAGRSQAARRTGSLRRAWRSDQRSKRAPASGSPRRTGRTVGGRSFRRRPVGCLPAGMRRSARPPPPAPRHRHLRALGRVQGVTDPRRHPARSD